MANQRTCVLVLDDTAPEPHMHDIVRADQFRGYLCKRVLNPQRHIAGENRLVRELAIRDVEPV